MRRLSTLLAALLLGSAAGVVALAAPAAAAACPAGQGVTVVVGSSVSCDADGGGQAADNFTDAGHRLTMVDRQPGFVCRVDGVPASASCVNTPPPNAYWALFWSDGTSGKWAYASQGAGALSVPAGGWVGFKFQDSNTRTPPGITPITAAPKPAPKATAKPKPKPKPTPTTTAKPAAKPTAQPSAKAAAPSSVPPTPASTPVPEPSQAASPVPPAAAPSPSAVTDVPQASSTPEATETADTASAANDSDASGGSGSLPIVAGLLVLALIGGMGAVLWRRKAAGGSS